MLPQAAPPTARLDLGSTFPAPTWSGTRPTAEVATGPAAYPGPRVPGSFVLERGTAHAVVPDGDGGWRREGTGHPVELAGRTLVLAYGSNLSPPKLTERLTDEPVVVLRCAILDHAVVWCDARRRLGDVVATLVRHPGRVEVHGVLALTERQLAVVDRWEGAPTYYERVEVGGSVLLENGSVPARCSAYVGTPTHRPPLRRAGKVLLVSEYPYDEVDALVAPR